jgi:hypothetical protein
VNESTIKIRSSKHFENPELKSFVDGFLAAKPNLEIIKVVNPKSLEEIEKVVSAESKHRMKRQKTEIYEQQSHNSQNARQKSIPQNSRLLSALAGHRMSANRISSPLHKDNNFRN